MSDPHGHGGGGGSGANISPTTFGIALVILVVFIVYFYLNPDYASNLIYILNIVQIICVMIIIFMANKLWSFMKKFAENGAEIVKNYESKLKHHHEHIDEKAGLKNKYALAIEHLKSHTENEWKTGLVEIDNFIRMSLLSLGYEGGTTIDVINDAKAKGFQDLDAAENFAYLRKHLKEKGAQFDFSREDLELLVEKFKSFKEKIIPSENHEEGHNDPHHTH